MTTDNVNNPTRALSNFFKNPNAPKQLNSSSSSVGDPACVKVDGDNAYQTCCNYYDGDRNVSWSKASNCILPINKVPRSWSTLADFTPNYAIAMANSFNDPGDQYSCYNLAIQVFGDMTDMIYVAKSSDTTTFQWWPFTGMPVCGPATGNCLMCAVDKTSLGVSEYKEYALKNADVSVGDVQSAFISLDPTALVCAQPPTSKILYVPVILMFISILMYLLFGRGKARLIR